MAKKCVIRHTPWIVACIWLLEYWCFAAGGRVSTKFTPTESGCRRCGLWPAAPSTSERCLLSPFGVWAHITNWVCTNKVVLKGTFFSFIARMSTCIASRLNLGKHKNEYTIEISTICHLSKPTCDIYIYMCVCVCVCLYTPTHIISFLTSPSLLYISSLNILIADIRQTHYQLSQQVQAWTPTCLQDGCHEIKFGLCYIQ